MVFIPVLIQFVSYFGMELNGAELEQYRQEWPVRVECIAKVVQLLGDRSELLQEVIHRRVFGESISNT